MFETFAIIFLGLLMLPLIAFTTVSAIRVTIEEIEALKKWRKNRGI